MLNLSESNVRVFLFTKHKILIKKCFGTCNYMGRDIYTITIKTHLIHLFNMTIPPSLSFVPKKFYFFKKK